jgi:hypothetical protein
MKRKRENDYPESFEDFEEQRMTWMLRILRPRLLACMFRQDNRKAYWSDTNVPTAKALTC